MIIHDGPATMIVAGAETGPGPAGPVLAHNDSATVPVFIERHQNVHNVAGGPSCMIAPRGSLVLSGGTTYWARTPDGHTANVHLVSTSGFANISIPVVLP